MDQELQQLGLTNNESKVYKTLIEIGENSIGPIIKRLGIHRQIAYDALEGLEGKNMVVKSVKGRKNTYRVANPKNILENIKQKERTANNLIIEINRLMAGQKKGQEIKIYEGERAYRELMLRKEQELKPNSEYYIVSGFIKQYMKVMKVSGVLEKSEKMRKLKKIKTKVVLDEALRKEMQNLAVTNYEYRYIKHEYNTPTAFAVWPDSVTLTSFGSEVFVIEIVNQDFHDSYLNYFNTLWKTANK